MIALLLALGCTPTCPDPEDRFDPSAWGYTPDLINLYPVPYDDGGREGDYLCTDGEHHSYGNSNYYYLGCASDWCTVVGYVCVWPDHFWEWWDEEGAGHGRIEKLDGIPHRIECDVRE